MNVGSGIRKVFKYASLYSPGSKPEFIEGDLFRFNFPIDAKTTQETTHQEIKKATQEKDLNTKDRILELLRNNPHYGRKKLTLELKNITEDGV
jgi:predicted HTH transcriptional regulator